MSAPSGCVHERGAVIFLLAAVLGVLLLGLVGFALSARFSAARMELQVLSDMAALQGAARLSECETPLCFLRLIAHVEALLRAQGHGRMTTPEVSWSVEVGRQEPGRPFEAIAAKDDIDPTGVDGERSAQNFAWQRDNPGLPAILAANAIQVSLSAPVESPIFPRLLAGLWVGRASTVAVAEEIERIPTAPFAVPACALLSGDKAQFLRSKVCNVDRLFSEVHHYCPEDTPDCGVVPDFIYDPLPQHQDFEMSDWQGTVPAGWSKDFWYTGNACFFANPRPEDLIDSYGVVGKIAGRAASGLQVSEVEVVNRLSAPDPEVETALGDTFQILPSGLTTSEGAAALWGQMMGKFESRPAWSDARSGFGEPQSSVDIHFNQAYIGTGDLSVDTATGRRYCIDQNGWCSGASPLFPRRGSTFGLCNSVRLGFGVAPIKESLETSVSYLPPAVVANGADPLTGINGGDASNRITTLPVWRTKIAVIADREGAACRGILGAVKDPAIVPTRRATDDHDPRYEVIKVVDAIIYDQDVGLPPPPPPWQAAPEYYTNLSGLFSVPSNPPFLTAGMMLCEQERSAVSAAFPWSFQVGGVPTPCNLVRARITCNPRRQGGAAVHSEPRIWR